MYFEVVLYHNCVLFAFVAHFEITEEADTGSTVCSTTPRNQPTLRGAVYADTSLLERIEDGTESQSPLPHLEHILQ